VRTAARRRRRLVTARSTANHVVCEDIPPVFLKTLYYPSTIVDIHEESGTYLTPASAIEGRTRLDQDEGLVPWMSRVWLTARLAMRSAKGFWRAI